MLVVANAYMMDHTRPLVPEQEFLHHIRRTIKLLSNLSPVSPVFKTNAEVLRRAHNKVLAKYRELHPSEPAQFDYSPGPTYVARTAPGTPQYDHVTSAGTSFSAPR